MSVGTAASWLLVQEARALLTRLARVLPFALQVPMVPAAGVSTAAQTAIEEYLARGRRELRGMVGEFLKWMHGSAGRAATPAEAQRRFTYVRLRFQAMLTQFDIFADALGQRSEHETGVRLAGLDVAAADALALPGGDYDVPPVICYLDRGQGAAIRRARTRLPGGGENPVAIIRIPRERMIGSGISSSLVHEVGHQGAALLELIPSLRLSLRDKQEEAGEQRVAWTYWERWISEIVADFWAIARVGVSATMGLLSVVSLPRAFVFRISPDDPHPFPWIRVLLSCEMGATLYPHPQWNQLARLWESFYPAGGLDEDRTELIAKLRKTMPDFAALLASHRPETLRGRSLGEALGSANRQPARLAAEYANWQSAPERMYKAAPSFALAVIGQAKADNRISPEEESRLLADLLMRWALRSALDSSAACANRSVTQGRCAVCRRRVERELQSTLQ